MFQNYLKIAWRNLRKNKVTSFINIFGLALGMAVAIMIGLWLQDELSFNKNHENYDRIVRVMIHQTSNGKINSSHAISIPMGLTLQRDFKDDFAGIAITSWNFPNLLSHENKRFTKEGMFVQSDFPEIFSIPLRAGSYETIFQTPNSIILNQSIAKALFGSEDPMGKTVRFNNGSDVKVTGIFEDFPKNSSFHESSYFTTWDFYKSEQDWVERASEQWGNHSFQLFAQLEKNADIAVVSAKIKDLEKKHNPNSNPEHFLFPMEKWHLYSDFKNGVNAGGRIQFVWLFGIIGVFVLLLACINFMNLSTARSEQRAKEVGIRKTIGSMKGQLIGQFLSESILVSGLALVIALLFVGGSLSWFNEIADKQIVLPFDQPVFWLIVLAFTLFTGFIAGSYPAFYLSSFNPLDALKGTLRFGRFATLPRKILVTTQFTVSVALIIGTLVIYQQIQHAKNRPVGYDRSNIMSFYDNSEIGTQEDALRTELLKTGKVQEAAYSSGPITNIWSNQSGFDWEGKDPTVTYSFGFTACSQEFGKTIGWELVEGRDFSRERGTDTTALILNEAAVDLIGLPNIVGRTISYGDDPHQVIGVVKNMIMESPYSPIKPSVFKLEPSWTNIHTVRLKPGVPVNEAIAAVEGVFKKFSPNTPFEYEFIDEAYDEKFRSEERIGSLAKVFAILAVLISCLGLFGLSTFVAERRTKEIGIRKVLGATVANLWAMQSKGFVGLVLLSCLIATPIAWYFLNGWLSDYEYRIELNWIVFFASTMLAIIVTLLTVSYQSIRAALANPVDSLKNE